MSTTLTNGLKLPDKGSVDWYADMQNNYAILDGAVGTIAEHTSALAGKAPLVHTHTKSDITDFPVYGNTAGTICEGNDSRLSDARTPVAHTHTKSDVTDLFNSENTWSKTQTIKNGYAKQILQNSDITIGVAPESNKSCALFAYDKNGNEIGRLLSRVQPDGKTITWISATNLYKNGAIDPTGSSVWANLYCAVDANGYPHVSTDCALTPNVNNTYELGTSNNKWKSLNGLNPGALSLPNLNYSDPNQWIDLRGNITKFTGGDNWYYPAVDGWIFVITNGNPVSLNVLVLGAGNSNKLIAGASGVLETSSGAMWISSPAPAGSRVRIRANNGSTGRLEAAWFITCQGNV